MIKKINKKIAEFLFPTVINDLRYSAFAKELEKIRLEEKIKELEKRPVPIMADLMRDSLGSYTVNATEVEKDGLPKHFLNIDDKDKRALYITQLAQIAEMEVWEAMWKNNIDIQANFVIRKADGELQILFGRGTINGISLLRDEVRRARAEYDEGRKPKEEFDEFETTEGITINKS